MKHKNIFLYFLFFILLACTGVNVYKHQYSSQPYTPEELPRTHTISAIRDENDEQIKEIPHMVHGESYSFCITFNSTNDRSLYLILLEDYEQIKFSTDIDNEQKYVHIIHLQKDHEKRVKVTLNPTKKGRIIIEPIMIDTYDYPYDTNTNMAYVPGRVMTLSALPVKVISND